MNRSSNSDSPGPRTSAATDRRDLARGAGVNYAGFVARLGARAPFLFLAGLLYGEARFGVFTLGITIVETAAALALFGMKRSLFKFMSEASERGESLYPSIVNGIAVALTNAVFLTILVIAMASPLASLFKIPSAAIALLYLSPAIGMIVVSDILLIAIRFTRQMRFEVYARSLAEPITLTLTVVVAYWLGGRENGLLYGYVASLTVAAGTTVFFFSKVFHVRECLSVRLRSDSIRVLIRFSLPTAGYDLLIMLVDKIDILLVGFYFPAHVVGVYGMARQLTTFTKKIRQGFDRILPPVISEAITSGDMTRVGEQLAMVSRWILSVQLAIVLGFGFYAAQVMGLFGGGFATGGTILALLLIGDAINGSLGINELTVVYLRPRANIVIGLVMVSVSALAITVFVRLLGPAGVALGVVVNYAVGNWLRVDLNRRLFRIMPIKPSLLKPVAAALMAALLLYGLMASGLSVPWFFGVPLLLVVYLGALVAFRLEPEDRDQLAALRKVFSR